MQCEWFMRQRKWMQYGIVGAISYPACILGLVVLAALATPFGLRGIFEQLIGVVVFPVFHISLRIVYASISNPMQYTGPVLGLVVLFSGLVGFLAGVVVLHGQKLSKQLLWQSSKK